MCAHPDHEVIERPDGSVAETHVLSAEDIAPMIEVMLRREPLTFINDRNY